MVRGRSRETQENCGKVFVGKAGRLPKGERPVFGFLAFKPECPLRGKHLFAYRGPM